MSSELLAFETRLEQLNHFSTLPVQPSANVAQHEESDSSKNNSSEKNQWRGSRGGGRNSGRGGRSRGKRGGFSQGRPRLVCQVCGKSGTENKKSDSTGVPMASYSSTSISSASLDSSSHSTTRDNVSASRGHALIGIKEIEALLLAQEARYDKAKETVENVTTNVVQKGPSQNFKNQGYGGARGGYQGRGGNFSGNYFSGNSSGNFRGGYQGGYQGRGGNFRGGNSSGGFRGGRNWQNNRPQYQVCGKMGHIGVNCHNRFNQNYTEASLTQYLNQNSQAKQSAIAPVEALLATPETLCDDSWFADSGASNHLTNNLSNLQVKQSYDGGEQVHIANVSVNDVTPVHVANGVVDDSTSQVPEQSSSSQSFSSRSGDSTQSAIATGVPTEVVSSEPVPVLNGHPMVTRAKVATVTEDGGLMLTQTKYIKDLLIKAGMAGSAAQRIPMTSGLKLSAHGSEVFTDPHQYRSVVGQFLSSNARRTSREDPLLSPTTEAKKKSVISPPPNAINDVSLSHATSFSKGSNAASSSNSSRKPDAHASQTVQSNTIGLNTRGSNATAQPTTQHHMTTRSQARIHKPKLPYVGLAESNCASLPTPMVTGRKFTAEDGEKMSDPTLYRKTIGSLQYLTTTRPDITFSVNKLSQFLSQPTEVHYQGVKRMLSSSKMSKSGCQGEMDFRRRTARYFRPGPEDPSLLYLQDRHISEALDRVICPRRHKALELLNPPVQIVPLLQRTGGTLEARDTLLPHANGGVHHNTARRGNTVGTSSRRVPVTGRMKYNWSELCLRLLGEAPPSSQLKGSRVNMTWFDERFSQVPENATPIQLEQVTRAYIMRLLACFLMPDTSGNLQSLMYLPLLENLDDVKKFSWGSAVLVYLYRSLCNATDYKEANIGRTMDDMSYDDLIPNYCREGKDIWRTEVPLIHFNIIEWHQPDRVLWQFGLQQPIPNAPYDVDVQHTLKLTGKTDGTVRSHVGGSTPKGQPYVGRGIRELVLKGGCEEEILAWCDRLTENVFTRRISPPDAGDHVAGPLPTLPHPPVDYAGTWRCQPMRMSTCHHLVPRYLDLEAEHADAGDEATAGVEASAGDQAVGGDQAGGGDQAATDDRATTDHDTGADVATSAADDRVTGGEASAAHDPGVEQGPFDPVEFVARVRLDDLLHMAADFGDASVWTPPPPPTSQPTQDLATPQSSGSQLLIRPRGEDNDPLEEQLGRGKRARRPRTCGTDSHKIP
ncbi:serine/threonine-protein phosphatase 7 long form-like protein [Senna tora]|uniref:Serine/threonine-protein phosphatase 7 long form-like protein n=1 Tax=Senna tora TaxID=362788 RepID=A0A834U2H2_9FABA|nr:serine/threonine-protein phosphatase 7 long form-like protein [Senna tora]